MKTSLLFLALTIFIGFTTSAQANLICHTPRMNKIIEINDNDVTFFQEGDSNLSRKLASVQSRTKKSGAGFSKTVSFENQKHTIFIKDVKNFSEVEDYIVIKAQTGHEVTYPLSCKLI